MTCFFCKGDMKPATTTYMTEANGCYIIVKNVPCMKCTQCGEDMFDGKTAVRLERIINKLKSLLTEVAIVDFEKAA